MNLGEFIDGVTDIIQENTGSPTRWSRAEIAEAVNDGLEVLSDGAEFYERTITVQVRPGATYYDLRHLGSETLLRVTSIYNPNRNKWMDPSDIRDLDERTARQWEPVTGESDRWFMRGLWWLGVFPNTTAENRTFQLRGKAIHPRLTDESQSPRGLPHEYHQAPISYAAYDLLARDGETSKALSNFQDYAELEKDLKQRTKGRHAHLRVGHMGSL